MWAKQGLSEFALCPCKAVPVPPVSCPAAEPPLLPLVWWGVLRVEMFFPADRIWTRHIDLNGLKVPVGFCDSVLVWVWTGSCWDRKPTGCDSGVMPGCAFVHNVQTSAAMKLLQHKPFELPWAIRLRAWITDLQWAVWIHAVFTPGAEFVVFCVYVYIQMCMLQSCRRDMLSDTPEHVTSFSSDEEKA